MNDGIHTIADLTRAMVHDFSMVQHYQQQITIVEDLSKYLQWKHSHEVTTTVHTELRRERTRALGIHPSSACKKKVCLLKIYYDCTHKVKPLRKHERATELTWDIGTFLHSLHQTYFHEMYGEQFQSEVPLKMGHITSSTDGLFSFTHYRIILEMKSIKEGGNYGWEKVQAKPMEDNVRQAHYYMKLADVPFAILLYIGKNNSEYKEHVITFNPLLWESMENEVIKPVVAAAYEKGPMVEATPSWGCRWCDYAHGCPAKGGDGGVDDLGEF